MTILLEERSASTAMAPAARLRTTMAAMRLGFTWFGVRKALSPAQTAVAAESFGAAGPFLSAGKKLLDTRHPRFTAVTAVRRRATAYFHGTSMPYPEPAVRLIRQDDLEDVQARMAEFEGELAEAVAELDAAFDDLRSTARRKLGRLYAEADYPSSLASLFAMSWDFPSVEPPDYLRRLSPDLYREECRRVAARFDEAVQLAEQMFLSELAALVSHLAERMSGDADGKPKIFRDSAVENLTEFLQRFRRLNIRSCAELDELVDRAHDVVEGVRPQQLRESSALRSQMAGELSRLRQSVDGLLVDRPRRNIFAPRHVTLIFRGGRFMELVIDPRGVIQCVYGEAIDLAAVGRLAIERASRVDPNDAGQWTADMAPMGGPVLGPFPRRTDALSAEAAWLDCHWLDGAHSSR